MKLCFLIVLFLFTANTLVPLSVFASSTAENSNVIKSPLSKHKLDLMEKPPLPKQFMRTPQSNDFTVISNINGNYGIALPKAFGVNPLADLVNTEGAMIVRIADNNLMLAVTVINSEDTISFNPIQNLPKYDNVKTCLQWQHENTIIWNCCLQRHKDYYGDKFILKANSNQSNKTYEIIFIMPAIEYDILLPQALYAMNSFYLLDSA